MNPPEPQRVPDVVPETVTLNRRDRRKAERNMKKHGSPNGGVKQMKKRT